jgi:hypothetical protein
VYSRRSTYINVVDRLTQASVDSLVNLVFGRSEHKGQRKKKHALSFRWFICSERARVASIAISNKANNFLLPSIHSAPRLQTCSRSRFPLPSILPPRPPPPPRPFLLFSIACLLACGSFHTNLHTTAEDRRTRKGARRRKGCLQSHHTSVSPHGELRQRHRRLRPAGQQAVAVGCSG